MRNPLKGKPVEEKPSWIDAQPDPEIMAAIKTIQRALSSDRILHPSGHGSGTLVITTNGLRTTDIMYASGPSDNGLDGMNLRCSHGEPLVLSREEADKRLLADTEKRIANSKKKIEESAMDLAKQTALASELRAALGREHES